jgi:hypothetical protein
VYERVIGSECVLPDHQAGSRVQANTIGSKRSALMAMSTAQRTLGGVAIVVSVRLATGLARRDVEMGSKRNPGMYDCHAAAEPDEEMFVLLGRDPAASLLVTMWVAMKIETGKSRDDPKLEEARECARRLEAWALSKNKDTKAAFYAFKRVIEDAAKRLENAS